MSHERRWISTRSGRRSNVTTGSPATALDRARTPARNDTEM
ncbi:hypothetical protein ACFFRL_10405 [Agromyces hippuratus]